MIVGDIGELFKIDKYDTTQVPRIRDEPKTAK